MECLKPILKPKNTFELNRKLLAEFFNKNFESNADPLEFYFCPFAINLMGNHLEAVGGNMLSIAIDKGIYAIVRKVDNRNIHLKFNFTNYEIVLNFDVYNEKSSDSRFFDQLISQIKSNKNIGKETSGYEIYIYSELNDMDLLSSSSSMMVLVDFILNNGTHGFDFDLNSFNSHDLKAFAERATLENAKKSNAVLFNFQNMNWRNIPVNFGNYRLAVSYINENKQDNSTLNLNRNSDFENALEVLKKSVDINYLCDAQFKDMVFLEDELLSKRTMYCISENIRVESLIEVFDDNFIEHMGKLFSASHQSLINEYESNFSMMNELTAEANSLDNCIGSRMVDADFGAYVISLVHQNNIANFAEQLKLNFLSKFNINVEVFFPKSNQGICKI